MTGAAPHVRLAFLNEDLVVFDLRADRYVALPGAVLPLPDDETTSGLARLDPSAEALLVSEGVLIEHGEDRAVISPPVRAMPVPTAVLPHITDVGRVAVSLVRAGRLLRGHHCRSFDKPLLPQFSPEEERTCGDWVTRLDAIRLLVPTPRRCLPAAMITGLFLRARGLETELVFGVRGHPFDAHCWLQRGDVLIDDELDRVRAYKPIAVGRL